MTRLLKKTALIIVSIPLLGLCVFLCYGLIVVPYQTAACKRNGGIDSSTTPISSLLTNAIWSRYSDDLQQRSVSRSVLNENTRVIAVNGPSMTFEHASTRYIEYSVTLCGTEFHDVVRAACGHPIETVLNLSRCSANQ